MQISPFKLERYFAAHEFKARFLLSASDCEALSLSDLLGMADAASLDLWRSLSLQYTESQGHPTLRTEIACLYGSVSPDDVVVAVPEEAIFIAMNTLLRPGDHAIVISPAYQSLYEITRALGCSFTRWELLQQADRWLLDLERLEASITPQTRLIVINFPHNPTGCQATLAELEAIVEIARRHKLRLFSDEMYRLLEYDPADRLPSAVDLYEQAVVLSGLSKSYALPGLRTGWLVVRDPQLTAAFVAFKDYTTICNSAPGEILAIMALRNADRILARNLRIIGENHGAAQEVFARHSDLLTWLPPRAGSIAFPRLAASTPVKGFCSALLDRQDVMVVPAELFEYGGNHFRVGLGRANFREALARFEEYIAGEKLG